MDAELLKRAQSGDRVALDALLRAELPVIRAAVRRYLGISDDFDDVAQKALIAIARSIGAFRGESALSTWIHQVCAHVTWDHLRARRAAAWLHTVESLPEMPEPAGIVEQLEAQEALRALAGCLDRIDPARRLVFVLHEVEGRAAPEIARLLSIPEGTVNSRLREARLSARRALKEHRPETRSGATRGGH